MRLFARKSSSKPESSPPSSPEKRDKRPFKGRSGKSSTSQSHDRNSHPLNLPPDELRRLSAMSVKSDQTASTPVDSEQEATASPVPSSPGTAASNNVPGSFPKVNGRRDSDDEESGPVPPPHRTPTSPPPPETPKVDPEACKAAGNKFFKAKDYDKAIKEYTRGIFSSSLRSILFLTRFAR